MPNPKPLVALACICEHVLREEDGVLSAIRIVDTIKISTAGDVPLADGVFPAAPLTALISLKGGDVRGKGMVALRLRTPSQQTARDVESYPIVLKGDEQGANFIVKLLLTARDFGLYGLDVYWNNDLLTSIPFRLLPPDSPLPGAK